MRRSRRLGRIRNNGEDMENAQNHDPNEPAQAQAETQANVVNAENRIVDIPGYFYDVTKKKYFKITGGWKPEEKKVVLPKTVDKQPNQIRNAYSLLSGFRRGTTSRVEYIRSLRESKLSTINDRNPAIVEMRRRQGIAPLSGCQFLELSEDSQTLFSCWTTSQNGFREEKIVRLSIEVTVDDGMAIEVAKNSDDKKPMDKTYNRMGICLRSEDLFTDVKGNSLVDACIAPFDQDVTCLLYAVASTKVTEHGLRSRCMVKMEPLPDFCAHDDYHFQDSPIYNQKWSVDTSVYSCAWNASKMRVSIGMSDTARILDVIAENSFVISSKRRNVISQEFSQDGNLLYMGLRADHAIQSDLRMSSKHVTAKLKGSKNTSYLRVLERTHPNCLVTDTFAGELKLWDLRRLDKQVREFRGHFNSHYRLPAHVDRNEQFLFAVGEDEITRGWSLATGDLLCEIVAPRIAADRTDFPRIVYSDSWGGRPNNSALIMAVEDSCRIYPIFH